MQQFERILLKYNCATRTNKPGSTFEEIENIAGIKLPDDYKLYLEKYLQFEEAVGEEYLRLWDFDELLEINTDYGIFASLPKTLGIGTNGGGECIAMEQNENGSLRIVLTPFVDLDSQYHIEIGTSFSDFLERLENGEEWFK